MAWAKGTKAQLIMDTETTYKSDPASPDAKVIPIVSCSLASTKNLIESNTITGNRNKKMPGGGNVNVVGDIPVELSDTAFSLILKHLLGSNTTTGSSDPYTHTMKIGDLPVGAVFEVGYTDISQYFKYNGCRIAGASFTFPTEGIVTTSFRIVGAKETVSSSAYDATPTSYPHIPFSAFQASILEGGGAIAIVKEVTIDLDNGLDESGYVLGGAGERAYLPEGFAMVSGNLTALFENVTLYNKAVNMTETSLKITLDRSVSPARSIEFLISEMIYERHAPGIEGPNGLIVNLPFKAYYDNSSEASGLQVTVKNGLSAI